MTNEEAAKRLEYLSKESERGDRHWSVDWSESRAVALRHLISEARRLERVREWTKKGYKFFPEMIDGFEWAQCEVHDILSAPDAETEVRP